MNDVKQVLEAQAQAWEQFKTANDEKLAAIEKRGSVSEYDAKLAKINADLERLSDSQKAIAAAQTRTEHSAETTGDDHRKAFRQFIRKGDVSALEGIKAARVSDDTTGGYLVPAPAEGSAHGDSVAVSASSTRRLFVRWLASRPSPAMPSKASSITVSCRSRGWTK